MRCLKSSMSSRLTSIMMWICVVSCHAGVHNRSPGVPKCTYGGESSLIPVGFSGSRMCQFDVPENGTTPSQVTMQYKNIVKICNLNKCSHQMNGNHGTRPSLTQEYGVHDIGGDGTWLWDEGAWSAAWGFHATIFGEGGLTRRTDPPPP